MYISSSRYGGVDWHDCHTIYEQLKFNESFDIVDKDKFEAIAENIVKSFPFIKKEDLIEAMNKKTTISGDIKKVTIIDGEKIYTDSPYYFIKGKKDYENSWIFDGQYIKFVEDYMFGQCSFTTNYTIKEIDDSEKVYVVTEDFLCPAKGVDMVARMYHELFTDEKEALDYYENLEIHNKDDFNSIKTLLIDEKSRITKTEWYKEQKEVMELMEKKKQTHMAKSFNIFTDLHIEELEKI